MTYKRTVQHMTFLYCIIISIVVCCHYSARYTRTEEFEKEASTVFKNVTAVQDGDSFEIELKK